jgi:hypothetical protein
LSPASATASYFNEKFVQQHVERHTYIHWIPAEFAISASITILSAFVKRYDFGGQQFPSTGCKVLEDRVQNVQYHLPPCTEIKLNLSSALSPSSPSLLEQPWAPAVSNQPAAAFPKTVVRASNSTFLHVPNLTPVSKVIITLPARVYRYNFGGQQFRHQPRQAPAGTHNNNQLLALLQLLPVIAFLLYALVPSSEPVYSMARYGKYTKEVRTR